MELIPDMTIDISILRHKARCLLALCSWLPVYFDANGIGTVDQGEAMIAFRVREGVIYEQWYASAYLRVKA